MKRTVTIIGAGPAGLTAARVLRGAGVKDVLVVERNEEPEACLAFVAIADGASWTFTACGMGRLMRASWCRPPGMLRS